MSLTRHPRDEEGAAASALLVAAVLVGFAIFVYMAIPFGSAVDAKAQDRTAADAAALDGAEFHALLLGDPPGERGGEDPAAGCGL